MELLRRWLTLIGILVNQMVEVKHAWCSKFMQLLPDSAMHPVHNGTLESFVNIPPMSMNLQAIIIIE